MDKVRVKNNKGATFICTREEQLKSFLASGWERVTDEPEKDEKNPPPDETKNDEKNPPPDETKNDDGGKDKKR